jgi:Fe-S oxidoreductase
MTKCPYVPPHPWNVDFPHLMLRAKAVHARKEGLSFRDRALAATDTVGSIAGIPVVAEIVNAVNRSSVGRVLLEKTIGVHREAPVPAYHSRTARKRLKGELGTNERPAAGNAVATETTSGKVAIFTTCYGNRNEPELDEDLAAVFRHNGIMVTLIAQERCCGMPRLELGDLEAVARLKEFNVPQLKKAIEAGYDIVAPIPSCVLMFKQELPLMFPDDADVQLVKESMFDPFEYLVGRHRDGLLKTDFKTALGRVSYHVPCHLRVQNMGRKTEEMFKLIGKSVTVQLNTVERCSGHAGTYGVKTPTHPLAMKIGKPVFKAMARGGENDEGPDVISSDCALAGHHIAQGMTESGAAPRALAHPLTLTRVAYGLE